MRDTIYRDDAIRVASGYCHPANVAKELAKLPSAVPDLDEWCTDCKEYNHETHSCPRWNRVIRQTVEDLKAERRAESEITDCPMCPDCPDNCPLEVEHE